VSKARRQRARDRRMEALRLSIERWKVSMAAIDERHAANRSPEALAREQERDRAQAERLRNLFTPEYLQEMRESSERMARINHEMSTINGILQKRLREYRPSGLGSCRTRRLRKKMAAHVQRRDLAKGER
jgi:hypothetical protein